MKHLGKHQHRLANRMGQLARGNLGVVVNDLTDTRHSRLITNALMVIAR
jgi:hypothetical protein